ncbi:L-lactate dehydrogenase [Listeria aquatica]|uniref:Lactate/malate dehydrogenase n=1 Tax=Listeria aquatica FSL S10-1188 TaxID=1265818 RepID=W7BAR5_9LIST|nr:L-lactate dehydrogenase [Listeria aquatica]EUJ17043.1 lactate/malate dehydrogenase [Listeria aquatica FSL S10-1188]
MQQKVGIIGCGHVGSDVAFSLVTQGICTELVLVDQKSEKASSEAMELRDMLSATHSYTKVISGGYELLRDASVIVMAIGPTTLLEKDRMEELKETSAAVRSIVPKVMQTGFNGIFINITNPCDVITQIIAKESGLPKRQVFGTGTSLDTMRMRSALGEHFQVSPKSISGYVLAEHGESQFIAWSGVKVGTKPALELLSLEERAEFKEKVRARGWNILLGKGWTSFGIATAAARLIAIIHDDAREVLPISVYDESEGVYAGRPAVIGRDGVCQILPLEQLTTEEEKLYQASCAVIKQAFSTVYTK